MNQTLLNSIRSSRGFSRSVTYLIAIALVGLVVERVIYYTLLESEIIAEENLVEKVYRVAPHKAKQMGLPKPVKVVNQEKSTEAKLSETSIGIKDTLDVLIYQMKEGQDASVANQQLAHFTGELDALDDAMRDNFAKTQAFIKDNDLDEVIQERFDTAFDTYETEMTNLQANLVAISQIKNDKEKLQAIIDARQQFEDKQLTRTHQSVDPKQLPHRSRKANPDNKPKLTPGEFTSAGLFDRPLAEYAALGDFTYGNLAGASNPAYLAETDEVVITQAIKDQAAALNHDPVQIYHWVRNNIEWLPTWSAMQDADITLGSKRGNAMDIASLTIALLRASQIPARYVHGSIEVPADKFNNWIGNFNSLDAAANFASSGGIPTVALTSGGAISDIRMEHIWVEVAADYFPSRAVVNKDADSWVQLDPSFKQYNYLQGVDVVAATTVDGQVLADSFLASGTINEAEGWVSGFDATILQNAQAQAQTELETYINTNMPNATVGDVIGGRRTIIKSGPGLPSSLPNPIVVTGTRYDKLPTQLQARLGVSLGKNELRQQLPPIILPWAKVNNHKLTVSFRPESQADEDALAALIPEGLTDISQLPTNISAYLIMVVPELKLNGQVVSTGQPMQLGYEMDMQFQVITPMYGNEAFNSPIIAGSYLSLASIGGSLSATKLTELQTKVINTSAILESGNTVQILSLNREDILGDMFYGGNIGYFAQYVALGSILGSKQGNYLNLLPSIGTYGYVPKVNYFFGFPNTISPGGMEMDLDAVSITTADTTNNFENRKHFIKQAGIISSALEHTIPEQMFSTTDTPVEAISAVKALAKAAQSGQRIYEINTVNMDNVLPNINHSPFVMTEITQALNSGMEVITHTDAVSVPGWSGAGYIILDPETGDGVYKIESGLNGAFALILPIVTQWFGVQVAFQAAFVEAVAGPQKPVTKLFAGIANKFAAFGFFIGVMDIAASCNEAGARAIIGIVTAVTLLIAGGLLLASLTLGPFAMFFVSQLAGIIMSQLTDYLKASPLCKVN